MRHVRIQPFDDARLRAFQSAGNADLLVDVYVDLLLGHPAVLMLEDVQRGFGVSRRCGVVQGLARVELAVSAALHLGHLDQRVELLEAAILRGRQARRYGEAVALQPVARGGIDSLQPRLGCFGPVGGKGQRVETHGAQQ